MMMTKRPRYPKLPTQLSHVTSSYAPGYRDLTLILKDTTGNEYELRLSPAKVQSLIYDIADVVKQINHPPPIDWDAHRSQIVFPQCRPWMRGPMAAPDVSRAGVPSVASADEPRPS